MSKAVESKEFERATAGKLLDRELHGIVDLIIDEVLDATVLSTLGTIKSHDNNTFGHSLDVAVGAGMLGKRILQDRESLRQLTLGSLLHDCGKVYVGQEILNKSGKLSPAEMEQINLHPELGYKMLRALQKEANLANHVAYQHHERQDGLGYPRGVHGVNRVVRDQLAFGPGRITLIAEIASVANIFDALSSDQPYRPALPPERVIEIIQGMAGSALNRQLVSAFLRLVPVYPVGMEVKVINGSYAGFSGVVVEVKPAELNHPRVRLLSNKRGRSIDAFEIDLAKTRDIRITSMPWPVS